MLRRSTQSKGRSECPPLKKVSTLFIANDVHNYELLLGGTEKGKISDNELNLILI